MEFIISEEALNRLVGIIQKTPTEFGIPLMDVLQREVRPASQPETVIEPSKKEEKMSEKETKEPAEITTGS